MSTNIIQHDVQGMIDGWLEAERNGEQFPVPFDLAWIIAGYKQKQHAKRRLVGKTSQLKEGKDYLSRSGQSSQDGRSSILIKLTCDAFKHFCLLAQTAEGELIRDYFIDAEKKWKLVQQHAPEVAAEVELIHLQIELAKIEAQKEQAIAQSKQADLQLAQFRHLVTTTMPEPQQQKILGYSEVTKVEYRDRVILDEQIVNDGSTILKGELCRRYGILTRNGNPDYKALKRILDRLPSEAFLLTVRPQDNLELRRDWLPQLDRMIDCGDRNLYLGE